MSAAIPSYLVEADVIASEVRARVESGELDPDPFLVRLLERYAAAREPGGSR